MVLMFRSLLEINTDERNEVSKDGSNSTDRAAQRAPIPCEANDTFTAPTKLHKSW